MLKIEKLSQNLLNLRFVCRFSSTFRHQFAIEKPIYYPKRSLSEEDELKVPVAEPEKTQTIESSEVIGLSQKTIDYYKILGVNNVASAHEIKTAYYNLAKKFHPDAKPTPNETETFRKISEAYQVLSDENVRLEYDRNGMVVVNGREATKGALGFKTTNFLRFFKKHPKAINNQSALALTGAPQVAGNNEIEMKLKFHQAVQGCKEYIDVGVMAKCPRCNGATRMGNQANIEFCPKCGGTGQLRIKTTNYMDHEKCETCDGRRYINKNSCKTCDNQGYLVQSKRVQVDVPPGTSNGDVFKINHPLNNQIITIKVNVENSTHFKRDGNNIATDKYLTISQAVLGGKCKIRGLYEDLEVSLGPGLESHTMHCFKGKGIRNKEGHVGDHVVTFKIRIPKTLTTKQRQLILALSRAEDPIFDGL
ncbi:protein tumorous imaginal discs, mitochondrial [Episyrphus balteatus]|uniref:protein tumorous imaginal discs, mitochondrial n=1 Tax=Episyrphus balteatus TaxID=286459 RepID=UPI0024853507|nr:protein tumorous imaginal discs, mitochondrial [Episyrphus balteatus]